MAIFQETHPLPMDPIAKRPLTPNDIEFLKELQHELNTQDSMGNRAPRFWVIKESREACVHKDDNYDFIIITDNESGEEIQTMNELFDLLTRITADRSYPYLIEKNHDGNIVVTNTDTDYTDVIRSITDETAYILNGLTGENDRFTTNFVSKEPCIVPDTLFLTHRACEEHLKKYGYNYTSDAHAYAMTADRSPEFETLLNLLQRIDLEQLSKLQALAKIITP